MVKIFQFRTFSKISEAEENPSLRITFVQAKFEKSDVLKSRTFEDPSFRICEKSRCEQAKDINFQF